MLDAVRQSRLPVYTVGLVEKASERESAKILGSFARNSAGGIHLTTVSEGSSKPIRTDVNGSEFGDAIMGAVNGSVVLEADLSTLDLQSEASTVRLELTCRGDNTVLTDHVDLSAKDLPRTSVETTQATGETQTSTKETVPSDPVPPEPKSKFHWYWLILGLLIVAAAVILFLLWKKRKKTQSQEPEPADPDEPKEPETPQTPAAVIMKAYEVNFISIPYGEAASCHQLQEGQPATFGRNSKAAQVLNPTDKQLSGIHFSLLVQDGCWSVRDEESKNGTSINGVPIARKGWVTLKHHDKLRAGSYEYRVVLGESAGINNEKGE